VTQQRRYSDFDLAIEGTADEGYRARVLGSPAGEASGGFTLPFSDLELENFLLKVGRPRGTTRRLESDEMKATRRFGSQLYDAVFQDDLRLILSRSIDKVESRGEGLRIRLRFTDTPELRRCPGSTFSASRPTSSSCSRHGHRSCATSTSRRRSSPWSCTGRCGSWP
jgi:hypothetical protein